MDYDVMNDVDWVIKHEIYQEKIPACSKNIRWTLFYVLKIFVVYQMKYRMAIIAWIVR